MNCQRLYETQSYGKMKPMKRELMSILVCPVCKGQLELKVETENEREIVTGNLYCSRCQVIYPIRDTIPNLLPLEKKD